MRAEVRFNEFRLDFNLRRLYRNLEHVKLTPKPFNTLEFLIDNRHRIVSKTELLENVWGERRGESTVEQAVRQLRKALQDDPAIPQYVETIPGQGYRFIAPVVDQVILGGEDTLRGVTENTSFSAPPTVRPSTDSFAISPADPSGVVCASRLDVIEEEQPMVPPVTSSRSKWRAAAIGMAGLGIVIFGVLLVFRLAREPNPQQATLVGAELTALDGAGHAIWHYQFPRALLAIAPEPDVELAQNSEVHVEDLSGGGKNEVLVAASYGVKNETSDELYCFGPSGHQLWRYQPHADFSFVGRKASGPWKLRTMTVVPEAGNTRVVWAAFGDPIFAPTFVASMDAAGHSQIRYISSGHVSAMISLVNPNGTFILAGGINNEYRAASLAVLESRQPTAVSPQTPGNRFECTNCPSGRPRLFVLLPRSEVNIGSGMPYNSVISLYRRGGAIVTTVSELRVPADGISITELIELSGELTPKNISFGAGYKEAHERLEKSGRIDHQWSECQEQKHPAIVRVWEETHGWSEIQIPWIH